MHYRYEIEHALANFALRGEGTEKIKEVRSDAVWHEIEHASANLALQRY